MKSESSLTIKGVAIEDAHLGTLRTADMTGDFGEQLVQNGYLFLRNLHDPDSVEAARLEVLTRLSEVGEVNQPIGNGIALNTSRRREIYPGTADPAAFWRSVSDGKAVRAVINGPRIIAAMSQLFQEPASHISFAWLRAMTAGRASPLHVDPSLYEPWITEAGDVLEPAIPNRSKRRAAVYFREFSPLDRHSKALRRARR